MNLQNGQSGDGLPTPSLMIKSTKGWKRRREFARLELHTSPTWGFFLIYENCCRISLLSRNESPIFRDKFVFPYLGLIFPYPRLILPYQRLFLREAWDLETKKLADKYPLRISRLYLFINKELSIYERMADWGT